MAKFWQERKMSYFSSACALKDAFPEFKHISASWIEDVLRKNKLQLIKTKQKTTPVLVRLTLPLGILTILALLAFLPFHYISTGKWYYSYQPLSNWLRQLGF